ncbi:hypothetical protein BDN72DRAFT_965468 [Pluteus cervinus]|uniref:Uncharacterized protein n=1 Tax=Pluteus cervinus TaxID=181527 RepID=A0ACD3A5A8_9AGAR|nr:hypothetical protein BDN72DRAFT_965468 [Pluteus cervinus]
MTAPAPHPILAREFESSEVAFTEIDNEIAALYESIHALRTDQKSFTEIDKAIAALYESIHALRTYRNSFSPISGLPPEILARIFSFIRQRSIRSCRNSNRSRFPCWAVVTSVSQYWRKVALRCPDLWSFISSSYSNRIITIWLHRSKPSPLSVSLKHHANSEFVRMALPRIRELKLESLTRPSWNTLLPDLSFPAPRLESLSISFGSALGRYLGMHTPPSTGLDIIFNGRAPSLRRLELRNCSFKLIPFTGLTALEIHDPHHFSSVDLLVALQELSRLTSLSLSNVHFRSGVLVNPVTSGLCITALPSLESLSIRGQSFNDGLSLLSHLSIPANSTLLFHSDIRPVIDATPLLQFLSVNKSARQPLSTVLVDTIDLQCRSRVVKLDMNTGCTKAGYVADLLKFELTDPWAGTMDFSGFQATADLLSYLPLTHLTSFHTNCKLGLGASTWTTVFGSLPELKHISVVGKDAASLLCAIVNDFKHRYPIKAEVALRSLLVNWDPIFPALERVDSDGGDLPKPVEDLLLALSARKGAGRAIKYIGVVWLKPGEMYLLEALKDVGVVLRNDNWDRIRSFRVYPGGDDLDEIRFITIENDDSDSDE